MDVGSTSGEGAPVAMVRILIVEDAEVLQRASFRILKRAFPEAEIEVVADGETAEALVRDRHQAAAPFSVIITDIVLPRRSGSDLARRLADDNLLPPTLFCSGEPSHESLTWVAGAGHPVLIKPFSGPALVEAVTRLLSGGAHGQGARSPG